MPRAGLGSYDSDVLKHCHIVLDLVFTQVQRVGDVVQDWVSVQVTRLPENLEDSEYYCCITFRHTASVAACSGIS
jgi:hypothetical protein